MSNHDPLCPTVYLPGEGGCRCALIARVRADERERIVTELEGPAQESEAMYAHAEQVAAKLVEIICEQDDLIQIVGVDATNHRAAAADMRRERDAARAEVERLRSPEWEAEVRADERENGCPAMGCPVRAARAEADKWQTIAIAAQLARDDLRAEVAALREQYVVEEFIDTDGYPSMRVVKGEHFSENEWAANIRREVLADLRAKVEELRDEAKADPVGSAVWRTTAYGAVLALIEEEVKNDSSN